MDWRIGKGELLLILIKFVFLSCPAVSFYRSQEKADLEGSWKRRKPAPLAACSDSRTADKDIFNGIYHYLDSDQVGLFRPYEAYRV